MSKKIVMVIISLFLAFTLSACGNNNNEGKQDKMDDRNTNSEKDMNKDMNNSDMDMNMDNSDMEQSGPSEVPEGLKAAENPTYKAGSQVILETDHMKGMKGAEATVVGAYDTIAYAISYTPTTGGKRVENHKWVIQQEIKEAAGDEPLKSGTEVTIEADHMKGMKGAKAEIDSAEKTTVYMVDYTPTTGGAEVKNHKWFTEDELSAK